MSVFIQNACSVVDIAQRVRLNDHFFFSLLFLQAVFRLPLPFSTPIFAHGALHTGSASERFTPLEVLYKCLNTKNYWSNQPQGTLFICLGLVTSSFPSGLPDSF